MRIKSLVNVAINIISVSIMIWCYLITGWKTYTLLRYNILETLFTEIVIGSSFLILSIGIAYLILYLTLSTPPTLLSFKYIKPPIRRSLSAQMWHIRNTIRSFVVSRAYLLAQLLRTAMWVVFWIWSVIQGYKTVHKAPWVFPQDFREVLAMRVFLMGFTADFCFDFPITRSKSTYLLRLHTIFDLMTLPVGVYAFVTLGAEFAHTKMSSLNCLFLIGFVRIWRLFGLFSSLKVVFSSYNPAKLQFLSVLSALVSIILLLASSVYILESGFSESLFKSFFPDCVYYSVVTIATVGYGDLVTKETTSKYFVIFAIMLVIIVVPQEIQQLITLNNMKKTQLGVLPSIFDKYRFYLIIGSPNISQLKAFTESIAANAGLQSDTIKRIVLLSSSPIEVYNNFLDEAYRRYKIHICVRRGDVGVLTDSLDDLKAVSANFCKGAFVLSNPANYYSDDKLSLVRCISLRTILSSDKIFLQLNSDSSRKLAYSMGVKQVLSFQMIKMLLLSRAITDCCGIIPLLSMLVAPPNYYNCVRVYRCVSPACFENFYLKDVCVALYKMYGVMVIGVELESRGLGKKRGERRVAYPEVIVEEMEREEKKEEKEDEEEEEKEEEQEEEGRDKSKFSLLSGNSEGSLLFSRCESDVALQNLMIFENQGQTDRAESGKVTGSLGQGLGHSASNNNLTGLGEREDRTGERGEGAEERRDLRDERSEPDLMDRSHPPEPSSTFLPFLEPMADASFIPTGSRGAPTPMEGKSETVYMGLNRNILLRRQHRLIIISRSQEIVSRIERMKNIPWHIFPAGSSDTVMIHGLRSARNEVNWLSDEQEMRERGDRGGNWRQRDTGGEWGDRGDWREREMGERRDRKTVDRRATEKTGDKRGDKREDTKDNYYANSRKSSVAGSATSISVNGPVTYGVTNVGENTEGGEHAWMFTEKNNLTSPGEKRMPSPSSPFILHHQGRKDSLPTSSLNGESMLDYSSYKSQRGGKRNLKMEPHKDLARLSDASRISVGKSSTNKRPALLNTNFSTGPRRGEETRDDESGEEKRGDRRSVTGTERISDRASDGRTESLGDRDSDAQWRPQAKKVFDSSDVRHQSAFVPRGNRNKKPVNFGTESSQEEDLYHLSPRPRLHLPSSSLPPPVDRPFRHVSPSPMRSAVTKVVNNVKDGLSRLSPTKNRFGGNNIDETPLLPQTSQLPPRRLDDRYFNQRLSESNESFLLSDLTTPVSSLQNSYVDADIHDLEQKTPLPDLPLSYNPQAPPSFIVSSFGEAQARVFSKPNAPLILICGWPRTLSILLQCLYYESLKNKIHNVIVLTPKIVPSSLSVLYPFKNFTAIIQGFPLRSSDLARAGVLVASSVLVFSLNHDANLHEEVEISSQTGAALSEEEAASYRSQMKDVDAILVTRKAFALRKNSSLTAPPLQCVTELLHSQNARFLDENTYNWWKLFASKNIEAFYHSNDSSFAPADVSLLVTSNSFLSGSIFVDSLLYSLVTCTSIVSNNAMSLKAFCAMIGTEETSNSSRIELLPALEMLSVASRIDFTMEAPTFGYVADILLRDYNVIPIGLLRDVDDGEKGEEKREVRGGGDRGEFRGGEERRDSRNSEVEGRSLFNRIYKRIIPGSPHSDRSFRNQQKKKHPRLLNQQQSLLQFNSYCEPLPNSSTILRPSDQFYVMASRSQIASLLSPFLTRTM